MGDVRADWFAGNFRNMEELLRRHRLTMWQFRLLVPESDTMKAPPCPRRPRRRMHQAAKLPLELVLEIREAVAGPSRERICDVARRTGVSESLVGKIVRGQRYPWAGGRKNRHNRVGRAIPQPRPSPVGTLHWCVVCREHLPESQFRKTESSARGVERKCRAHPRERVRRDQRRQYTRIEPVTVPMATLPHEAAILAFATKGWTTRHEVSRNLGMHPHTVRDAFWRLRSDGLLETAWHSPGVPGTGRQALARSRLGEVFISPGFCRACKRETFAPSCCGRVPGLPPSSAP